MEIVFQDEDRFRFRCGYLVRAAGSTSFGASDGLRSGSVPLVDKIINGKELRNSLMNRMHRRGAQTTGKFQVCNDPIISVSVLISFFLQ